MPEKWLTSEIFNPTFTLTDSAVSSAEGVLGVDAGGGGGGASPLPSPLAKKKEINIFLIHSKYFSDSDWLKAHAQFTITSY